MDTTQMIEFLQALENSLDFDAVYSKTSDQ